MSYSQWEHKIGDFKVLDLRATVGHFFPQLKKIAQETELHQGLHIVQSFEPIPLYEVMDQLGFERHVRQEGPQEYHAYFYRVSSPQGQDSVAMRPAALTNLPLIDGDLADLMVNFWDLTWNDQRRFLPQETRLLLSMANAVGAQRMRQAARELVKAYVHGLDSAALDDLMELLLWQQGMGFFNSEIAPSAFFGAYRFVKLSERKAIAREEICRGLMEKFGEKNPDVKVL